MRNEVHEGEFALDKLSNGREGQSCKRRLMFRAVEASVVSTSSWFLWHFGILRGTFVLVIQEDPQGSHHVLTNWS